MGTLATSTISLATVHTIWDNTAGSVTTLVTDLIPYMLPFMLLMGALFIVWRVARGYIGGL